MITQQIRTIALTYQNIYNNGKLQIFLLLIQNKCIKRLVNLLFPKKNLKIGT